jgi:hypothetical protein
VGEAQARDGGDLQAAELHVGVAAVVGLVHHGDVAPRQGGQLVMQRGLVGLDDQQVGGLLAGDQPVGVLALGMERVGADDPPGEVQTVQQRPEPGDLVGRVVHVGLAQDRTGGVVHRGQQVHRRPAVITAAAQGLAVDRDRPPPRQGWWWLLVGQPSADDLVQRVGVDAGQHAAHGGLGGWPPRAGQRVAARPERSQDRPGRISSPLADRGQGPGAGQHRGDRDGQHRAERVPPAAAVAWVGHVGEVVEQAAALVGRQHGGRGQPVGNRGNRG